MQRFRTSPQTRANSTVSAIDPQQATKPFWGQEGKQKLAACDSYRDLWSNRRTIPKHRSAVPGQDDDTMTSIVLPIQCHDEILGALGLFTDEYLEITDEAKIELQDIADAIGLILRLYQNHSSQSDNAVQAAENIKTMLLQPLPRLTKPSVFLASSLRAREDVVEREVLAGYGDKLKLIYWQDMDDPGNITEHLLTTIASCRYGICYFSEETEDGHFVDNANVVFEAGMFQGRRNQALTSPVSWIPLREAASTALPFDFAQERMILIERNEGGEIIDEAALRDLLRRRVDAMLSVE
jgi:hypothetical protein